RRPRVPRGGRRARLARRRARSRAGRRSALRRGAERVAPLPAMSSAPPAPRAPRTAEELYECLAFAPGAGPFRIKGTGYVFHDQWVRENLPGGLDAQHRALGALHDHPFFRRDFVSAVRYDLFPLVALGHACAAVRGET